MKYTMLIDQSKCIGCSACSVECKREYDEASFGILRTRMKKHEKGEFPQIAKRYYKNACMHCLEEAACIAVCPVDVIGYDIHEDGGMVLINYDGCIGCGACVGACPFGAPVLDEERVKAEKCSFCHQEVLRGRSTICADACPTGAILFGEREEMISKGEERVSELIDKGKEDANLYGAEGTGVLIVMDYDYTEYDLPEEDDLASNINLPKFASASGGLTVMAALGGLGLSYFRKFRQDRLEEIE